MDGLMDFGDDQRFLALYKALCRHVYDKHPTLVREHIALFRTQFEERADEETQQAQGGERHEGTGD